MLIGYSSYFTTLIRSNADPAVDMYNVDNPMSFVGYLDATNMAIFLFCTDKNLLLIQ